MGECSSHTMCHVSPFTCHFFSSLKKLDKVVELVGGGSVINKAYPINFYFTTYIQSNKIFYVNIIVYNAGSMCRMNDPLTDPISLQVRIEMEHSFSFIQFQWIMQTPTTTPTPTLSTKLTMRY